MTPEQIAEQLGQTGICICPEFLSHVDLRETRADLERVQAAGRLHRAGIGRGKQKQVHDEIRRDEINWLERRAANPVQQILWEKLDALRRALNQTLYLGLQDFEGHYAVYPSGGFYRRHLDSFRHNDARAVSLIVYLNADWKKGDGGELRIYGKDGASYLDVAPIGGTLVCFLSQQSEHEVRPCIRPRLSFTGWYRLRGCLESGFVTRICGRDQG